MVAVVAVMVVVAAVLGADDSLVVWREEGWWEEEGWEEVLEEVLEG
jgi:hypothetical protein